MTDTRTATMIALLKLRGQEEAPGVEFPTDTPRRRQRPSPREAPEETPPAIERPIEQLLLFDSDEP